MMCLWCWNRDGNEGVQSVTMDDKPLPASVEVTHYDGTANPIDPWFLAAFAATGVSYPDDLAGWCWSAVRMPAALAGQGALPQIAAVVRGPRAYDERSGLTAFTENASLLTARWIEDPDWGMGMAVDHTTVPAAANANDELVGGAPRRRLSLVIERDVPVTDMLEALRTYAGIFVLEGENGARFVPDRPLASFKAIGDGTAIPLRAITETRKSDPEVTPTLLRVWYTDRSQIPWRQRYAEVQHPLLASGGVPYRDQDVRLPGIPDHAQGFREGRERMNKLHLADLSVDFGLFNEGVAIEPGDGAQLTSAAAALTGKRLRIFSRSGGLGDYDFTAAEYDPLMYSDEVVTAPSYGDTTLSSPNEPQPPTGLSLLEELFETQGDKTASRIRAAWSPPANFPWVDHYRVNVRAAGEVVWTDTVEPGEVFRSGILAERAPYQVDVITVSRSGASSEPASDTITAQGKLLPPGNILIFTGFESGGEVFLTIGAVSDIDMKGYEVRYGAPGVLWADARFVDFKPAASGVGGVLRSSIIPEGTFDFLVCARDSGGRYSAVPARLTLTVTKDDRAFLVDNHVFDEAPTLTLMSAVRLRRTGALHWITDAGDDMNYGHADPNPATGDYSDLADQPFSAPRSGGTAIWQSALWDVGTIVSGNWAVTADVSIHSGTVSVILELSEDGQPGSFTDRVGTSHKATGRFARVRIEGDGVFQVNAAASLRIDAVPRTETHTVTTSAAGPVTVTLDGQYTFVKSIKLTLVGQPPGSALYDNVQIAPDGTVTFEVERFDSSDVRLTGTVDCEVNAV